MNRKFLLALFLYAVCSCVATAQTYVTIQGKCGDDGVWSFDGHTLYIERNDAQKFRIAIPDYDIKKNPAPWVKRNLPIKKIKLGIGINRIGSCAFANCSQLETIEFFNDKSLSEIGWGAFLNCTSLFNFSMPVNVRKIEKIAFANCKSLRSVKIPAQAVVEDYAFLSCTNLSVIDIANNVVLGKGVFSIEVKEGDKTIHKPYTGEIRNLPLNITVSNCVEYGLAKEAVSKYSEKFTPKLANEIVTSPVDTLIPQGTTTRYHTYALIIGNENYRFVPNVPFAKHDAKVFSEYCEKTLGIPTSNIHLCYDATKHMIMEQEIDDWLKTIPNRGERNLIIYYAGHGVPDVSSRKSYLLPVDVYGTKPKHGLSLDDFYYLVGNLGFKQVSIFMDACFSGINRNNEAVNEGLRGTEIVVEDSGPSAGNLVVFSAAQGNETAQGYLKEGHGLFTYYLLKEIQESLGEISYGVLADRIKKGVVTTAQTLELRKNQTPTVKASGMLKTSWEDLQL